ncbi:hypothetical protein Y032_0401g781 [Ancylostoma ceylanicum]|nr:hypothetical protein Y032_0401g781 [Ancylostoma ceylanicum]
MRSVLNSLLYSSELPEFHGCHGSCQHSSLLFQAFSELSSVAQCDVLVVEGIGRSFCSGADLGLIEEISTSSLGSAMFRYMSGTLAKIHSSPLVSVARINGHCLGGGSEIASSCDLRFAHKNAKA